MNDILAKKTNKNYLSLEKRDLALEITRDDIPQVVVQAVVYHLVILRDTDIIIKNIDRFLNKEGDHHPLPPHLDLGLQLRIKKLKIKMMLVLLQNRIR